MIQERFKELSPYLKGLKVAEKYNIVEVTLKTNWKVVDNDEIGTDKTNNGLIFFSETKSFDQILDWLQESVINYNIEIEEKQRLLSAKVAELKRVFETSSLDELNNLRFSTEDDVLELHSQNTQEEDGPTEELSQTN
jgi:hypothetical protein